MVLYINPIYSTAGVENSQKVSADASSYTIDGLQPNSAYIISISGLVGSREGAATTVNTRTGLSTLTTSNRMSLLLVV